LRDPLLAQRWLTIAGKSQRWLTIAGKSQRWLTIAGKYGNVTRAALISDAQL